MKVGEQVMDFCKKNHLGRDVFLEILNKARDARVRLSWRVDVHPGWELCESHVAL